MSSTSYVIVAQSVEVRGGPLERRYWVGNRDWSGEQLRAHKFASMTEATLAVLGAVGDTAPARTRAILIEPVLVATAG